MLCVVYPILDSAQYWGDNITTCSTKINQVTKLLPMGIGLSR